jgi:hypothetical protein
MCKLYFERDRPRRLMFDEDRPSKLKFTREELEPPKGVPPEVREQRRKLKRRMYAQFIHQ